MTNIEHSEAFGSESSVPVVSTQAIPVSNEPMDGGEIILDKSGFNPKKLYRTLQEVFPQSMPTRSRDS